MSTGAKASVVNEETIIELDIITSNLWNRCFATLLTNITGKNMVISATAAETMVKNTLPVFLTFVLPGGTFPLTWMQTPLATITVLLIISFMVSIIVSTESIPTEKLVRHTMKKVLTSEIGTMTYGISAIC